MKRIGIDVGGTNTDAVLMSGDTVLASVKTFTSGDVTSGIKTALSKLLDTPDAARDVRAVTIGTTHYTNAVVERKNLNRAAAIRVSLPASASLPPFCDWPDDLAAIVAGGVYLVHGGHEYDGREIVPLDERAIARAARDIRRAGVDAVAISSVFSPLTDAIEQRAADIVRNEHPAARISLSSTLGRIGLLERENVALLNAALSGLALDIGDAIGAALRAIGLRAELYISQNDGTVARADSARTRPVFSFSSGPVNSMRGAALLGGQPNAMVCDVGGTTADVGCIVNGFPRQANSVVEIGGVRTLFRMPDVLSIGVGGGTVVSTQPSVSIGPRSVGFQLAQRALVFGGDTLTCTDIAVAAGLLELGDPSRLRHLSASVVGRALAAIHALIAEAVDRMKSSAASEPLLAVGGAAALVPDDMPGISQVMRLPHDGVANAVGAAIAQISGETDRIFRDVSREQAIDEARELAIGQALEAGAIADTIEVVDVEDLALSYLPGQAVRVRVRVVGDAL